MDTHPSQLKKKLLVPLSLSIFVLIFISVLFFVSHEKSILKQNTESLQKSGQQQLKRMLADEAKEIEANLIHISADKALQKAWLSQSREQLLSVSQPLYAKINKVFNITHFYFIDISDTCYLRVHNPSKHGDRINRFTFQKAKQDQQPTYGLEMGVLGTFTLRYVYPWIIDGQLKGYLELGKEIGHFSSQFKEVLDADVAFLIHKKFIEKDEWEKGSELFDKTHEWDTYDDYIATGSTIPYTDHVNSHLQNQTKTFSHSINDETYQCSLNQLFDVSNQNVGHLLISKNVTKQIAESKTFTIWLAAIGSIIFIVLFVLFWFYISNIEYYIKASFNKMKSQSEEIEHSLEEKKIMIKEIHHRVKNNLQIITALLSLQSSFIEEEEIKAIFRYSQYRIDSMAMVHEMLYQSNDLAKINYKEYIEQLVINLIDTLKGRKNKIELEIDVPEFALNIDTAIPLGLIINEVITNSLKYGLSNNKGKIRLKITKLKHPNFVMEISDDGKGYPDEINFRNTNSLGLLLIHKLSLQLRGGIEKDNTKKGTHYIVTFQEIEQTS